tara:strand:+ start:273 stop:524 length:252 start_codon:yes stop_codon:yes gene_type:complete
MNEHYRPRNFTPGAIVEFVFAPPRWKGEDPRSPGAVVGKLAVVIDYAGDDVHQWGGIFNVAMIGSGKRFMQYGDFMQVVSDAP